MIAPQMVRNLDYHKVSSSKKFPLNALMNFYIASVFKKSYNFIKLGELDYTGLGKLIVLCVFE